MEKRLRVFYAAGPGDVVGTYRHWRAGEDDPSQIAVTYSGQFFDLCRELGAIARVVSRHPRRDRIHDNAFDVANCPALFDKRSGVLFHVGQYLYNLWIAWQAMRWRADVCIISDLSYLAPLWIAKWFGLRLVISEHCTLWPVLLSPKRLRKAVLWVDRKFYRSGADGILSISEAASQQIRDWTGSDSVEVVPFFPSYRRTTFSGIGPNDPTQRLFGCCSPGAWN
jgi:glycogen(starch) synthase